MPDIQALREERKQAAAAVQAHAQLAQTDKDAFDSAGGMTKHTELMGQHTALGERITVAEEAIALAGETVSKEAADRENISVDEATNNHQAAQNDFVLWARHGNAGMRHMSESGRQRYGTPWTIRTDASEPIIAPPSDGPMAIGDRNDATDTAAGANSDGVAVPIEVSSDLTARLKSFAGPRNFGTVQTSMTGRSRVEPTVNDTSQEGEIIDAGDVSTDQDINLGGRSIGFNIFSSKVVPVNRDWLRDTATADVIAKINRLMATRLHRIQMKVMNTKSGKAKNNGLIDDMPVGVTLMDGDGRDTTIPIDGLNALVRSIDPAYRTGVVRAMSSQDQPVGATGRDAGMATGMPGFTCNDTTFMMLANLKDSEGRPLLMPAFNSGGEVRYLGYPFFLNQGMASPAANAKTLAFGQLGNFEIYDVGAIEMERYDDSTYRKRYQVGFQCFMRTAYRLIDDGDSVKVLVQAAA